MGRNDHKRGRRTDKKERRRQKPDEVMKAGPLQIARFGQFTHGRVKWDPAEYVKMRASLPGRREELKSKISAQVAKATALIERYNPLLFVNALFWKNGIGDIESYSEPEDERSEAIVEYAHNLVMAVKSHGSQKPGEQEHRSFEAACTEILQATTLYFMLQESAEITDIRIEETRFLGIMRYLHVRGSAMIEHETDLLLELFSPHDAFFARHGFPETKAFVALCADVLERVNSFAKELTESLLEWRKLQVRHIAITKTPRASPQDALKQLVAALDPAIKEKMKALKRDPLEPHVVPFTDSTRVFCNELSLDPGDNKNFLAFKKSPAWPTNNTVTTVKPFVRIGSVHYAINPVSMMRTRVAILEDYIQRTDPKYFGDQFAHTRGKIVERLALAYLAVLLPSAQVFPNVFYSLVIDGESRRFEADGVMVFDEYLFLLEMKSAPFSTPAMRGASGRMAEDLDHLVGESYKQALRTLTYLRMNSSANLEYEDRRIATTINLSQFRRIYIVNVTLADIGHVSARLNSARAMRLVDGVTWPWSVYINDLRVAAELIKSPAEFLLYLERRLAINELKAIATIDELDYLGMFLQSGLYFEKGDLSGLDRFTPIGYTVAITRYYDFLAGRVSSGPKPSFNVSPWYRNLVSKFEALSRRGSSYVALLLLSLDGNEHKRIEGWFIEFRAHADAEPRTLTLLSKSELPILVVVVFSPKAPQYEQMMSDYARMKRMQMNGKPLVWIAIRNDLSLVDFGIQEGPLPDPDREQMAQLMARRRAMYDTHVHSNGEPGRNEICPCNSGLKFKRCCLEFVPSWTSGGSVGPG